MLKLIFRWQVLKAVIVLIRSVGDAVEDSELSDAERAVVMKNFWALVKAYKRD